MQNFWKRIGSEPSLATPPSLRNLSSTYDGPYYFPPAAHDLKLNDLFWIRKQDARTRLGIDLNRIQSSPNYINMLDGFLKDVTRRVGDLKSYQEQRIAKEIPSMDEIEQHGIWITCLTSNGCASKSLGRWIESSTGQEIFDVGLICVLGGGR